MVKYALLTAINKYKEHGNDLNGCIHDLEDMYTYVISHGFDTKNVHTLKDDECRKNWMIDEFNWLMDVCEGDEPSELLLHYSGHGSQVPSSNDRGEIDGLDEILCPWDCDMYWENPLSDNVLRDIFKKKPKTANLTVILDCCHSGTGTRNSMRSEKQRYMHSPTIPSGFKSDGLIPINRVGVKQKSKNRGMVAEDMNHVLLAACRDNQTAADALIGGRYNGAWTWSLVGSMKRFTNKTVSEVFMAADLRIRPKYEQRPVLEGSREMKSRLFLGGHE